jgi:hypothetical protein
MIEYVYAAKTIRACLAEIAATRAVTLQAAIENEVDVALLFPQVKTSWSGKTGAC